MYQLHFVTSISQKFGGMGLAALRYSESLAKAGSDVALFVIDRERDEWECSNWGKRISLINNINDDTNVYLKIVNAIDSSVDLVHIHGVWSPSLAFAAIVARQRGIPFIISPHGALAIEALKHKKYKKKIALLIYQKWILNKARLLVATANIELDNIRELGLLPPIAIIPNGVDKSDLSNECSTDALAERKILFLSRVHPIKGLVNLVNAWDTIRQAGWKIIIAGPDEENHTEDLKRIVSQKNMGEYFEFVGLVSGARREKMFQNADLFILPSFSENFGIAIAEALIRGVPVITTTGAPWQDLVDNECGWWVEPTAECIADAIRQGISKTKEELESMGRRGRDLCVKKYTWDGVGELAFKTSQWLLDSSSGKYVGQLENVHS